MGSTLLRDLQAHLGRDTLAFLPELVMCGGIVLLLLIRLFARFDRRHLGGVALVVTLYALYVSWDQWTDLGNYVAFRSSSAASVDIFTGLLAYDNFTIFLRLFLYGFAALVIWLTLLTGIPDREDSADFYCLLLGATVGMAIMASANHLMMVFIGVEMASLPSYALAGFLKGRRQSSEAALKYVVYGGGAAGVMLYGISLLAGRFGTGYLPDLALALTSGGQLDAMVVLGSLFVLIGIAFKLAAVPFHFWCPDVFEGASAEVAGFLSVASKGAALALLARFVLVLAGLAGPEPNPDHWRTVALYMVPALAFFAAATATFGNLAAYWQTNLKRMLAYSTIAHAGYMMMGLATLTKEGAEAVLFYLVVYLFMNLGAFAMVAFIRNRTGSEDLDDLRGLVYRSPVMVLCLAVFVLSLLGMPPLAGFVAKFQIFQVLYRTGQLYASPPMNNPALASLMYALLVIGGLNSVLSLFYYANVLRVMILEKPVEEVEGRMPEQMRIPLIPAFYGVILALVLVVLGILWEPLADGSHQGVESFQHTPVKALLGPSLTQVEGGR